MERIGIFMSTLGSSPLIVGLMRALPALGISVDYFKAGGRYDCVLVVNQCAHTTKYEYPSFKELDGYKLAFIDTAEYGWGTRIKSLSSQYANSFTHTAMTHDTKNTAQQTALFAFLNGKSFPYFMREYLKDFNYPPSYHPVDYPLYLHSMCHSRPDKNDYIRRSRKIFLSWGASHPFRRNVTDILRQHAPDQEILIVEEKTSSGETPRMPQAEYFRRMFDSKVSVSYDGYGSSSFREMEILCRTVLLKGELAIVQRAPLTDGVNFIEYHIETDEHGLGFISSDLGQKFDECLANPDRAFEIYQNGYEHCMQNYTEVAVTKYVLSTIAAHDYSQVTPLQLTQ